MATPWWALGVEHGHGRQHVTGAAMQSTEKILGPLTRDPARGRHVTEAQALLAAEHEGTKSLFCSDQGRMLFALRPGSFAVEEGQMATDEALGR
jgi:YHS domain-containing protein